MAERSGTTTTTDGGAERPAPARAKSVSKAVSNAVSKAVPKGGATKTGTRTGTSKTGKAAPVPKARPAPPVVPAGEPNLISVRGAREHNLRDVDIDLPRDRLVVLTGLSGSGKSSLAFDTIYAEGQRRYVESLSSYARQFLGQMDKPDVDFIEGLSPAISIDQKSASRNPRSTVGTITEIYDYLRLLYARIGIPHCPKCGRVITRQTPQQIVDRVLQLPEGTRFQVLAPVVRGRKGEYEGLLTELSKQGFTRARIDGEVVELSDRAKDRLARYENHTIEIVVDRLVRRSGIERRLTDSLETALRLAEGVAEVEIVPKEGEEGVEPETLTFSEHLACTYDGLSFDELAPRNFSFNSPYGACERCDGLGTRFEVDPELIVADDDLSIREGALTPWSGYRGEYFNRVLDAVGDEYGFTVDAPWKRLTNAQRKVVLFGAGKTQVLVRYKNRYGRKREYKTRYEGVIPWLERRYTEADSDRSREQIEGYMREVPCTACNGARLRPASLGVTIAGQNISEVGNLSIRKTAAFFEEIELNERERLIAARVLKEVNERLRFLLDVGLDYLSLNRNAGTLAGGEAQRIRLASQIGSGLVGVLYVLDEPSIGLHQRDNQRLIDTMIRLRDLGNTVLVVEHDEETIRVADHIVDIGPGAGEHGGEIVVAGSLDDVLARAAVDHRPVPLGREDDPGPGVAARARRRVDQGAGRAGAQPPQRRREHPARVLRVDHRGERQRQEHAGERHPLPVADAEDLPVAHGAGEAQVDRGGRRTGQGHQHRPVADRADATVQPGHVHRRVRQGANAVRRDTGGEGARVPAGPVLVQREGRPLRGVRRRRDDQDRDALPPRRVRAVRGLQGRALQPGHARHHVQGQEHCRGARPLVRGGGLVLREPADDRAVAADACRRRPRLRPPGPARTDAVRG